MLIRAVAGAHPAYTSEYAFQSQGHSVPSTDTTDGFTFQRMLTEVFWRITPLTSAGAYVPSLTSGHVNFKLFSGSFDVQGTNGRTALIKCDSADASADQFAAAGNMPSDNSPHRNQANGLLCAYGVTSFSDFGVGDGSSAALPIELLNFNAFLEDSKVKLTWTTATEINNDYFTVERTLDGISFEEVLEMPGAGNSFTPLTYIADDNNPELGVSYYRLKQTDYDGKFEYSGMVEVENNYMSSMSMYEVAQVDNSKVVLKYQLGSEVRYDLYVYDITGKIVKHDVVYAEEGVNQYELDVKAYQSGTYFISLQNNDEIHSDKFIIRR
jgi:hypothetical protein